MLKVHRQILRRLRASAKRWSSGKDKSYHDKIFSGQVHDPFCVSYPGNLTIRRFADLTAPYLVGLETALDLGCGTGEITCELAGRFPGIAFTGIDHSEAGINRAGKNARSLNLENASFLVGDVADHAPAAAVDIVLMFDSFHHMTDPRRFVVRFGKFSKRFLLVEPQGDWKGGWKMNLDFDWIVLELDKIRARIAYLFGEREPDPPKTSQAPPETRDAPIEHRYTMNDFLSFFPGYGLDIRGTVSGLDVYPPDASLHSPSRQIFGKLAYETYVEVDKLLFEKNLDLLAKHWVIFAERGARGKLRSIPSQSPVDQLGARAKGPYDVEYIEFTGPRKAKAGESIMASLKIRNRSFRIWTSRDKERADYLSYHWLSEKDAMLVYEGERSPLPRSIGPDEECDVPCNIRLPDKAGHFILAFDLVRENTTWYSEAGSPCLRIPFQVDKPE